VAEQRPSLVLLTREDAAEQTERPGVGRRNVKISDPKSDWYIPPDWRFILSWHFIIMPAVILTTMFALALPSTAV